MLPKLMFRLSGILFALLALWLVYIHPLQPWWLAAGLLLCAVWQMKQPLAWLAYLPALLPVLDLTPWSGRLLLQEYDLLLLTALAVGYWQAPAMLPKAKISPVGLLLFLLLLGCYGISLWRGTMPLPAFTAGAMADYYSPYSAVRAVKAVLQVTLFIPLLRRAFADLPKATGYFVPGLLSGLLATSLVALLERWWFPGVLDFSSDYRITASFSEMHTGGAALDGYLALCLPFVAWIWVERKSWPWHAAALAVLVLGAYAALVTFSRGVYLAAGLSLITLMLGFWRQVSLKVPLWLCAALLVMGLWVLSLVFNAAGYRGLIAAQLLFGAALMTAALPPRQSSIAAAGALSLFTLLGIGFAWWWLPKGAYVGCAMAALVFGAGAVLWAVKQRIGATVQYAALPALAVSAVLVGWYWGGQAALLPAGLAILFAAGLWWSNRQRKLIAWSPSGWVAAIGFLLGPGMLIPVLGNYYMSSRFSEAGSDVQTRLGHWSQVAGLVKTEGWTPWLGVGAGRMPQTYALNNHLGERPGRFEWQSDAGNGYLRLIGSAFAAGFADPQRIGQRVSVRSNETVSLDFDARVRSDQGTLAVELCEKWLIYPTRCDEKRIAIQGREWRHYQLKLSSGNIRSGLTRGLTPVMLSFMPQGNGSVLELDNVSAIGAAGELLNNGDFQHGNDRWFFTSDRHHLPWHAKNLWLHVYFEQGVLGLLIFSSLLVFALLRALKYSRNQKTPYAPYWLAGLVGFLAVGLFDALLDFPRIMFLFYLMLLVGCLSPASKSRSRSRVKAQSDFRATSRG